MVNVTRLRKEWYILSKQMYIYFLENRSFLRPVFYIYPYGCSIHFLASNKTGI